jgi:glycosyltransferase involved in cell wall biosynthesis
MSEPAKRPGPLKGRIDHADRRRVSGWAADGARPGEAVELELRLDGAAVGRFRANRFRKDLADAGIGTGHHAFVVEIPGGLSAHAERVIELVRAGDGAALLGSPVVLPAEPPVGEAARRALEDAVAAAAQGASPAALEALMRELMRALAERLPEARPHQAALLARWGAKDAAAPEPGRRRALVIDESIPDVGRDAGSHALLSHMRALRRLGFEVEFVPSYAMEAAPEAAARLEAEGFRAWLAPWVGSVEEVLRLGGEAFEVVYVHRVAVMLKYAALVRRWCPGARLLYCVADLHHLRAAREAALMGADPEAEDIARLQEAELAAIQAADAPITHSPVELARLAEAMPGVAVHLVPWEVALPEPPVPAALRKGVAFVGSFGHMPNRDAAWQLLEEVMPLVWETDPTIPFLLAGSGMPADIRAAAAAACGPVEVLGQIPALGPLWARARVACAPLRFGAGIKGKVLDALAAGIPCVCTPIAAEGMELPEALMALVGETPAEMAASILRLHADDAAADALGEAGRAHVAAAHAARVIDAAMAPALGLGAPRDEDSERAEAS